MGDQKGTLRIENDDISLKTKLNLKRFGGTFGVLSLNGKPSFKILLCFTPYRDYRPTNASHVDRPGTVIVLVEIFCF